MPTGSVNPGVPLLNFLNFSTPSNTGTEMGDKGPPVDCTGHCYCPGNRSELELASSRGVRLCAGQHTSRMFIIACKAVNYRVILTQLVTF